MNRIEYLTKAEYDTFTEHKVFSGGGVMELQRQCAEKIRNWVFESKKALLVKGARQVGKTHLIRSVLHELDCDYLEINLIETPSAVSLLEQAETIEDLTLGLSAITEKVLVKGKSIIFIDEVQKYPDMVTKIKFFVDEGSFRYILSGSLLGVELTGLESAPVGYMSVLEMYPLSFSEFLQVARIDTAVTDHLRQSFLNRIPVLEAVHEKMLKLFTRYLLVGGMPEAVVAYAETGNLNRVAAVHHDIYELYKMDFSQYESVDKKLLLENAYDLIPAELLKQNRRFIVTDLKKGLHFERVESTFLWLYKAGVAIPAFNATEPRIPLKLNEKQSLFKLYLSDVGMLTSLYGMNTKRMLLGNEPGLNAGGIYENAVAQELHSKGFPLYYYNSNRLGELDFVIESKDTVLPLEIKSGKDYTIHSAINNCLSNPEYGMQEGIVFANCNVSTNGKVTYLPIYMMMFLEKDSEEQLTIDPLFL